MILLHSLLPLLLLLGRAAAAPVVTMASEPKMLEMDVSSSGQQQSYNGNFTSQSLKPEWVQELDRIYSKYPRTTMAPPKKRKKNPKKPTKEEKLRAQQRVAQKMQQARPPLNEMERVNASDLTEEQRRRLGWGWNSGGGGGATMQGSEALADPSQYYDMWSQAYRMLGGFIDCDHQKDEDSGSGDNRNNYYQQDGGDGSGYAAPCSRWMMWAAYVNPNYEGNGYYEYYGDSAVGYLDCHKPNTEWELLGVYRQEFYQFVEQISKHVWAIDDYEYVVALAGLAYMTDYDCWAVGQTSSGGNLYAGVAPQQYGKWEMALYEDEYCLEPTESYGTFGDYVGYSDIDLGSEDNTDDDSYSWASEWWYSAQEYTLTDLNDIYEEFKYCTSCVDYPTYQDGYFIGDDGTDDDDLINQCWKFYSHDNFNCEADCIAMAHAQGSILSVNYGGATFGSASSDFYMERDSETGAVLKSESSLSRLAANAFLTMSFLLFVATFLAFAVARRSRYRESRSSRSRRLLDEHDGKRSGSHGRSGSRSRKSSSRKSSSRSKKRSDDADGLFRTSGTSGASRSKSKERSRRSSKTGGTSSSSRKKRSKSYDPPKEQKKSSSSHREQQHSSSNKQEEFF